MAEGDEVFAGASRIGPTPVALWCGESDGFYNDVRALQAALPQPVTAAYDKGAHTRGYWNRVTPAAFDFIAAHLA